MQVGVVSDKENVARILSPKWVVDGAIFTLKSFL